jgi:hypothetical protein
LGEETYRPNKVLTQNEAKEFADYELFDRARKFLFITRNLDDSKCKPKLINYSFIEILEKQF